MSKKKSAVTIDILSHTLVPEMMLISDNEKNKILKKYGINDNHLTKMLETDPEAIALNAKIGDVIVVKRKDPTGNYDNYRLVIKD